MLCHDSCVIGSVCVVLCVECWVMLWCVLLCSLCVLCLRRVAVSLVR